MSLVNLIVESPFVEWLYLMRDFDSIELGDISNECSCWLLLLDDNGVVLSGLLLFHIMLLIVQSSLNHGMDCLINLTSLFSIAS